MRVQAEQAWLAFGTDSGRRVEVFRLLGYLWAGPQRDRQSGGRHGEAHVKPGQAFNRIHVDDIALVLPAIDKPAGHTLQRHDDEPPAPGCRRLRRAAGRRCRPRSFSRSAHRHGCQLRREQRVRNACIRSASASLPPTPPQRGVAATWRKSNKHGSAKGARPLQSRAIICLPAYAIISLDTNSVPGRAKPQCWRFSPDVLVCRIELTHFCS